MARVVSWLYNKELRLFLYINHKLHHAFVQYILNIITHVGGAAFTIVTTLSIAIFAGGELGKTGWQAFAALAFSHVPVAIIKRLYPRLRPYLVLPRTNIGKQMLKDHSFPSGHTTAVFASATPFILAFPMIGFILIPVAFVVAFSRIYLGLHYPSDCAAGMIIGTGAGYLCTAFI
jgi:undecaprenyl-diphosphatase